MNSLRYASLRERERERDKKKVCKARGVRSPFLLGHSSVLWERYENAGGVLKLQLGKVCEGRIDELLVRWVMLELLTSVNML